jgi:hypothetical protein
MTTAIQRRADPVADGARSAAATWNGHAVRPEGQRADDCGQYFCSMVVLILAVALVVLIIKAGGNPKAPSPMPPRV